MNTDLSYAVGAVLLILAGVLLINPFDLWMPGLTQMAILAAFVVLCGALALFVLLERAGDERDEAHRALAGRAAFLAGGTVLLAGIVVQSLAHDLDPWLVGVLVAMVAAKAIARWYATRYR